MLTVEERELLTASTGEEFLTVSPEVVPNGIKLYAKSPKIEAWMKERATRKVPSDWGEMYEVEVPLRNDNGANLMIRPSSGIIDPSGHWINLSFFKLVGLGEGITFTAKGIYPNDLIDGPAFRDLLTAGTKGFIKNFLTVKAKTYIFSIQERAA